MLPNVAIAFETEGLPRQITIYPLNTGFLNEYGRIFLFLLQHIGETCAYEAIVKAVWGGRKMTKNACQQAVSRLQRDLLAGSPYEIEGVHDKGYRLITRKPDQQ